jgi:alpha-N-arabinofuranosidase
MSKISRRGFALGAGAACLSVVTSRKAVSLASEEKRVEVQPGAELGRIRPELHGHFAEHLGSCIYGGLWVGKDSRVPNINGYRKQAIDYLRALGIPVLRWPGGCFADDYHWRDGIGPPERRPKSVNLHWGRYVEDNSFGTHEFIGLCRLIGAEPYLAGNVGSGTPRELRDWMEYCNHPSGSSLAEERAANGSREPFGVRYWGVGNENWGCGGQMTPEEYAAHYRQFATFLRSEPRPFLIACGPNRNNLDWSRRFMEATNRRFGQVNGFAMHFYSNGKSPATQFTVETMQAQLETFSGLEKAILEQRELLDKYDPKRTIGLMVDEWGVWDRIVPEEEKRYGRLWQQITMRGAVAAALGINVFHRQADKLVMCNIAQMVNVLHALLLTDATRCVRTPAYYAFELMKPHRSKTAVRIDNPDSPPLGLSVSASKQEKELVLTFVNPKHDAGMNVNCSVSGGAPKGGAARILHHEDMNACNTFDRPDRIVPREHPVRVEGSRVRLELPPLSIVTASLGLG